MVALSFIIIIIIIIIITIIITIIVIMSVKQDYNEDGERNDREFHHVLESDHFQEREVDMTVILG
jgi:Na+/melibiose symporter-like transporter